MFNVQVLPEYYFDRERRLFLLIGEVDDHMAMTLIKGLSSLESETINIILSSPGGSQPAGWAIYDALMAYPGDVNITCYGYCMSIAPAILQAGTKRLLKPHCDILVHAGSVSISGEIKQNEISDMAKQIDIENGRYYTILANRSGQSIETVSNWCKGETVFSSYEAVELGLADEVDEPKKYFETPKRKRKRK